MRIAGLVFLLAAVNATALAVAQGDPPRFFDPASAAARPAGAKLRVELIGDSTQTDNAGYGRGFCANFTPAVSCVNMARGGASTKTFRTLGLWDQGLAVKPDVMVIQFGHNDMERVDGTAENDRQVSLADYVANLRRFVMEARAAGITPVLCTPLTRRYFGKDGKIHSDLTAHTAAMKKLAAELGVPVIDLQTESIALLDNIGEDKGNKLAITKKDNDGKTTFDKTHLNWAGSYIFGRMVAKGLADAVPAVKPYVLPEAAKLPPAGVKAMHVIEGGPVKIVLVGDSTVATGGGWGPGFCHTMTPNVTCVDLALNGRSTKSFIDEGAWSKALAEKGDYYLIQFGHNDQKPAEKLHTDADGSFQTYLKRYIADVRAIGGVPVLVTSLSRRTMKDGKIVQDLDAYADATRKVGAEENLTVVDLNRMSTAMLNHMTQAQADDFDMTGHPDEKAENAAAAKLDRTHLNPHGQEVFGRMVADNLVRTLVELGPDVKGEPAGKSVVPTFAPQQAAPTDGK